MRISTSYIHDTNLSAMLQQQTELAKTQLQVTTGKRIQNPSDDPAGSVQILNLQREFSITEQYIANSDNAQNRLEIEESTLGSVTDILQRIRELAVQGLNATNTQSDRQAIAVEISQLNEELLALANTRDSNGDYLFSGFQSNTVPYENITGSYQGDEGQRNFKVGAGVFIETNDPGNEVFESAVTQVLSTAGTTDNSITAADFTDYTISDLTVQVGAGSVEVIPAGNYTATELAAAINLAAATSKGAPLVANIASENLGAIDLDNDEVVAVNFGGATDVAALGLANMAVDGAGGTELQTIAATVFDQFEVTDLTLDLNDGAGVRTIANGSYDAAGLIAAINTAAGSTIAFDDGAGGINVINNGAANDFTFAGADAGTLGIGTVSATGTNSSSLTITNRGVDYLFTNPVTLTYDAATASLSIQDNAVPANTAVVTPYQAGDVINLDELNAAFPDYSLRLDGTLADGDTFTLATGNTPSQTMFRTIENFANALRADAVSANDSPNNGDFLTNIQAATENVIDARAKIGARLNAIEQQRNINENVSFAMEKALSEIQDLDYTEAISRLTRQLTGLQAAQQSFARVQGLTLFNFL